MLIDAEGQLRWASASDQTAQTLEDGEGVLRSGSPAACFVWPRDCMPWLLCCAGLC
jgi:hypothetical protein